MLITMDAVFHQKCLMLQDIRLVPYGAEGTDKLETCCDQQ